MGPVETLFLTLFVLFGAIGIVRGYVKELGVTTLLLIGLFVIDFLEERFGTQVTALLIWLGIEQNQADAVYALIACLFLIFIAFISYQGVTLTFPGAGSNWTLGLAVGLINGYLFAGSIWYYLAQAGWPLAKVSEPYTDLYKFLVQLLPPEILSWPYFIGLAVLMLILRTLK